MDHTIKCYLLTACLMGAYSVFAADPGTDPVDLVPGGEVVQLGKREVKIRTKKGTIVEIEYRADGKFDDASGDNIVGGDVLVPGGNLLTLADAYSKVTAAGLSPVGEWSLEKTFMNGWIYEMNGFEQGRKMEYEVDAETGKLLSSHIDD